MQPRELITRSNGRGALALGRDWAGILALAALGVWAHHWAVYLACICVIGTLQYAIAEGLLHEASHYNLFKTKWLNDSLQVLYAWPFFIDFRRYRTSHFAHHGNLLGDPDPIPDGYYTAGYQGAKTGMWWLWLVRPALGYGAITYLFTNVPHTWRGALRHALVLATMLLAAWRLGGLTILLMYWFVPLLCVCSVYYHWAGVAEHLHTKKGASRSNVSWLWNLFYHNQGYHSVHHQYPAIPWYNLKTAHQAFCGQDTDISTGFFDTYRQVSNPVGAIPLRALRRHPTKLIGNVMTVLNWRPGAPEQHHEN